MGESCGGNQWYIKRDSRSLIKIGEVCEFIWNINCELRSCFLWITSGVTECIYLQLVEFPVVWKRWKVKGNVSIREISIYKNLFFRHLDFTLLQNEKKACPPKLHSLIQFCLTKEFCLPAKRPGDTHWLLTSRFRCSNELKKFVFLQLYH